jgi:hypothetical protein
VAGNQTITVASTANFNPKPFWINNTLVTCNGFINPGPPTTFANCSSNPGAGTAMSNALSNAGTGLLGGWIKIEVANAAGVWTDVTTEILNYGIGGPSLSPDGTVAPYGPNPAVAGSCLDPTPNAIIRLQRLRDNGGPAGGGCNYNTDATGARDPNNWWPYVLFDTREAIQRDANPTTAPNLPLGGLMYYVALDAGNLARWFKASVAPYNVLNTGLQARIDNTGYTVYFSDRRNNRNGASQETAEYGWEDFVNPGVAGGVPNNVCDLPSEDVNGNGLCETYGKTPNYNGVSNTAPPGNAAPLTTAATPTTLVSPPQGLVNRPIIFRRALRLINGAILGSDPVVANRIGGLTVVSENPVYLQGDWNAAATFAVNDLHAATSIIADAVTILSNSWNDMNSFTNPYHGPTGTPANSNGRARPANSYFRVAILAGKGPSFAKPSDIAGATVFGTDGGAHNFLRMLEGQTAANGTPTVNYRGSMATLAYSRQAIGAFKCCSGTSNFGVVYSVPTRNFIFDTDFLIPALLPPNTPVFRDMNAVGFSQEIRPGR